MASTSTLLSLTTCLKNKITEEQALLKEQVIAQNLTLYLTLLKFLLTLETKLDLELTKLETNFA